MRADHGMGYDILQILGVLIQGNMLATLTLGQTCVIGSKEYNLLGHSSKTSLPFKDGSYIPCIRSWLAQELA